MLHLVLPELLSILKFYQSPKVPPAIIKEVQLEKLCNIPLDEGRQGTIITLLSEEHVCQISCSTVLFCLYF